MATDSQIKHTRPDRSEAKSSMLQENCNSVKLFDCILLRQFHVEVSPCKTKLNHFHFHVFHISKHLLKHFLLLWLHLVSSERKLRTKRHTHTHTHTHTYIYIYIYIYIYTLGHWSRREITRNFLPFLSASCSTLSGFQLFVTREITKCYNQNIAGLAIHHRCMFTNTNNCFLSQFAVPE
jgi:hypothetical protein